MYFTPTTPLPVFVPLPVFIWELPSLSLNAKMLYALLLHRTQLSQQSGWTDGRGRVYVVYPVANMAKDLRRSERTVHYALRELEKAQLVARSRQGATLANHLYLRIPEGVRFSSPVTCKNDAPPCKDRSPDAQKLADSDLQSLQTNKKEQEIKELSKKDGVRKQSPRRCLGEYENVFLTDEELASIQAEFPAKTERYIQKLSTYMETSGHHYRNHAAVLRKWLREDAPKQAAYSYDDCADMCI